MKIVMWVLLILVLMMAWTQRELTSAVRMQNQIIYNHEQDIRALQQGNAPPVDIPQISNN